MRGDSSKVPNRRPARPGKTIVKTGFPLFFIRATATKKDLKSFLLGK